MRGRRCTCQLSSAAGSASHSAPLCSPPPAGRTALNFCPNCSCKRQHDDTQMLQRLELQESGIGSTNMSKDETRDLNYYRLQVWQPKGYHRVRTASRAAAIRSQMRDRPCLCASLLLVLALMDHLARLVGRCLLPQASARWCCCRISQLNHAGFKTSFDRAGSHQGNGAARGCSCSTVSR